MAKPPAALDEARLEVWREFLTVHTRVQAVLEDELERERGLPLPFYDVLVQLSEAAGGRLRMQELASSLLFSRSGVTRLVDRMAREELVRREPCTDDRRGTFAVITGAGRRRVQGAAGVHLRGVARHFGSPLGDADVRALHRALGKIIAAGRQEA